MAAALLGGCGSGAQHGLTSGQRSGLIAQLEAARVQAAAHDVAGTETALRRFRGSVARLERSGAISSDAAHLLRLGAVRVLARVRTDAAPPPQPTVTTPAPAPVPVPAPAPKHGPKPGKGFDKHGKGKGHGKKDGGD